MAAKNVIIRTAALERAYKSRTEGISMEKFTVEQALEALLEHTKVIEETETVPLLQACGRVLAKDMIAGFDNPPFDRSPVDGYACKAEDITDASESHPVQLTVLEEIDAGQYSRVTVEKGQAVRIVTGAAIPKGCDCCVRQEDTDYGEETVRIFRPTGQWQNYCYRGENFKNGTVLLKKGDKIGFIEAGILASMGVIKVKAYRRVRAAVLTTGDEVMAPGKRLIPGKIYDCNQGLLAARMKEFGAELVEVAAIEDRPQAMTAALERIAPSVDLIVTTGAVSVGKKDIMHEALEMAGAKRIFWHIQMKPGMPTLFSMYQDTPVISLSGNPFGVAVSIDLLLRPVLHKMTQDEALKTVRKKCLLKNKFSKTIRGRRYVRAMTDGETVTIPTGLHSNGVLSSMAGCNCLIEMQEGQTGTRAGEMAEVILL